MAGKDRQTVNGYTLYARHKDVCSRVKIYPLRHQCFTIIVVTKDIFSQTRRRLVIQTVVKP